MITTKEVTKKLAPNSEENQELIDNGVCPFCDSNNLIIEHEPNGKDEYTTEIFCMDCRSII